MTRREWTRKEEEELVRLRLAGLKILSICRRLARPEYSVKRKLVRLGVVVDPFKTPRRKPGELKRVVKTMAGRGLLDVDMAELLSVDPSAVRRCRYRLGIGGPSHAERLRQAARTRRVRCA